MSRKSQLEKWDAKWAKQQVDEQVVIEAKMKEGQQNESVWNEEIEKGEIKIKTEGKVAFVADRDALTSSNLQKFLSGLSREGVKDCLKDIEESSYEANKRFFNSQLEVIYKVQEQASYDGTIRALRDFNNAKENGKMRAFNDVFSNETKGTKQEIKITENQPQQKEDDIVDIVEQHTENTDLDSIILEAYELGVNVLTGSAMKKFGGKYSTAYQKFMKENRGVRGAWRNHVEKVLGGVIDIDN